MAIEHMNIARTLSIVRQMAQGKVLTLKCGCRIGMAEDMTMGFLIGWEEDTAISQLSEMTLRQLDALLTREGVGMAANLI